MPGGLVLLLLTEWKTGIFRTSTSALPNEWPDAVLLITLLVLLAYPVGRIAFNVGAVLQMDFSWWKEPGEAHWQNPLSWRSINLSTYRHYRHQLPIEELAPFGVRVSEDTYQTLFHEVATRWVFLQRPDLYFVSMTRGNTLRVLADTTLGVALLAVIPLSIADGWSVPQGSVYAVAVLFCVFMAYRLRWEQSRGELLAAFITYSHIPPDPPDGPTHLPAS